MSFVDQIPQEVFRYLRYVNNLIISNYYSFISGNDFYYFENLVHLHFVQGVQEIKPKAFNGLKNLVYLNLSDCDLSYLDEQCFNGLFNLEYLNLKSNCLREIGENVFSPLRKLIYLNLNDNRVKKLNLRKLKNLRFLDIGNSYCLDSKIKSIKVNGNLEVFISESFSENCNLKTESIKYLFLNNIPSEFPLVIQNNLDAFKNLEFFEFQSLCIDHEFLNIFNFKNLKVLIGRFENIPKFGQNLCNLKYLKIYNVKEFNQCCLEVLNNLDYLDIEFDDDASLIENIEENHFKGINDLKYLSMTVKKSLFTTLLTKRAILENLFKTDENLLKEITANNFQIMKIDLNFDPLKYVSLTNEITSTLDTWFWTNIEKL
ncbi:unnamed protein product [Brachionus calyciflorus]|uniref:Uncharacterized protein n=1 Tax=Brachionus calyciflorus TaxID=104777 RepID=A0A814QTI0_9BILA|nr:unnamed protein product [Brachionus calyciflorus]